MPPTFLYTIEQTGLSTWLRDSTSPFGFWLIISVHAVGMGMLVGVSGIVSLRVLGLIAEMPLSLLDRMYPLIWTGFWIQMASGVLLLIAYPTKALTTTEFYVKMALIGAAMVTMVRLRRSAVLGNGPVAPGAAGRALAVLSLAFWSGALAAGRLIAYTATYSTYPAP